MTSVAHVVKVMIASPTDVGSERQIIREVIGEWNAIHTEERRVVLIPLSWEKDASPIMGERAQAIVNRQLLRDADLLIAAFWTRLGSPTGTAASGTVEEIEEHLAARKPAMLYFSRKPARLDRVDPGQYKALTEFKESCKQRGLIEEYDDGKDLRAKLVRQLSQTLQKARGLVPAASSILAGPNLYDQLGYRREDIFGLVQRKLILAGANLRGWLSDSAARQGLVDLVREKSDVTVTFVLGTPGILRELQGEGEAHLRASIRELSEMREELGAEQRSRMRCFFHWGAATLSAVFIDPDSPTGVLFFTPRWGYDYNPRQRLTCMIERRRNSDLFDVIYDPLLLLTQPNVSGLDEMLALLGRA
jgi:hypothetical protein